MSTQFDDTVRTAEVAPRSTEPRRRPIIRRPYVLIPACTAALSLAVGAVVLSAGGFGAVTDNGAAAANGAGSSSTGAINLDDTVPQAMVLAGPDGTEVSIDLTGNEIDLDAIRQAGVNLIVNPVDSSLDDVGRVVGFLFLNRGEAFPGEFTATEYPVEFAEEDVVEGNGDVPGLTYDYGAQVTVDPAAFKGALYLSIGTGENAYAHVDPFAEYGVLAGIHCLTPGPLDAAMLDQLATSNGIEIDWTLVTGVRSDGLHIEAESAGVPDGLVSELAFGTSPTSAKVRVWADPDDAAREARDWGGFPACTPGLGDQWR